MATPKKALAKTDNSSKRGVSKRGAARDGAAAASFIGTNAEPVLTDAKVVLVNVPGIEKAARSSKTR